MAELRRSITMRLEGVVLSFPNLFNAEQINNKGAPKFTCVIILPEGFDAKELQKNIAEVHKALHGDKTAAEYREEGKEFSVLMKKVDGKTKLYEGRPKFNSSASEDYPPGVVDFGKVELPPRHKSIYSGAKANVFINLYAWEFKNDKGSIMKRGVSAGLGGVQILNDEMPRLDNRPDIDDMFDSVGAGHPAVDEDDFDF